MVSVQDGIGILAVLCQLTASILMIKQKLYRQYPVFFSYNSFEILRTLSLFLILAVRARLTSFYRLYFSFYWTTNAVCYVLSLLVVYEIVRRFFYQRKAVRQIVSVLTVVGLVVLLILDIVLASQAPGYESYPLLALALLLERSVSVIQSGIVVVLLICATLMALPWRRDLSFGMSLGFGIIGAADLTAVCLRTHFGRSLNKACALSEALAYLLAVLVWVVYIRAPQTASSSFANLDSASAETANWNRTLTEVLGR